MGKVKVGIIGIGSMGKQYVLMLDQGQAAAAELAAVCTASESRAQWVKDNTNNAVQIYHDANDFFNDPEIDAVIIARPHYDHPELAMKAFASGLHVLIEKPAGVYTKNVLEMNDAAKKSGKVFGIMYNQRTNPLYQKLRELIHSGEIGEIKRTNWIVTHWYRPQSYYDSSKWRATWEGEGGGVLLNQAPHQLDLWQWICGMPKKVEAHLHYGKWHDIEVEDDVTAYVEYENGATGVFITTTGDACGTNRFEIQLDRAKIIAEYGKLSVWELEMGEQEFSRTNKVPFGCPKATQIEVELDGKNEQHVGVLNAWAAAILRGEPLVADGREGINGLMLSNAMHLSSFLGREVELPFDEQLFKDELMKRVATSRRKAASEAVFADTSGTYGGK